MEENLIIRKLNDIAQIGSSKRIFRADYVEKGIPFYRSKEIIQKSFNEKITDLLFITEKKYFEIKKKYGSPTNGDILISSVGNRSGIPYLVKDDGDFYFKDGNLIWFKNFSKEIYSPFLVQWLKSNIGQNLLLSSMIGSAQRALTIEGVKNLNITVPPLQDQRAIAFILSNLDNKIELNLQINKTLEDMAMAIYKHWFVDFGPFQSGEFVDSELGMIPKGWEVKRFGDLYDLKKGLSYKSKYYSDDGIPMINLKCFNRNGGFRYDGVKYYSGDFKDSHLVIPGDLMIAMTDLTQDRAVLGSPIICPEISTSSKVIASLDIGILQQNKKRHQNLNMFYYYEMRTRAYHEYILGYGNGSTVMHLDKKGVLEYNSILPEVSIIQRFNNIVGNFRERISSNNKANQTLTTLRDTLLPKLISGEVRVKDIKQTVAQML